MSRRQTSHQDPVEHSCDGTSAATHANYNDWVHDSQSGNATDPGGAVKHVNRSQKVQSSMQQTQEVQSSMQQPQNLQTGTATDPRSAV